MEFLFDYLDFLAKTATLVVAVLIVISAIGAVGAQRALRRQSPSHIEVVALNEQLQDMHRAVEEAALPPAVVKRRRKQDAKERKRHRKAEAKREKQESRQKQEPRREAHERDDQEAGDQEGSDQEKDDQEKAASASLPRRVFVLSFEGDIAASAVDSLRREISAVLGTANKHDEIVVRVESPGGMVHGYGLAASQLARIRSHGVQLTVAVDKVAASGGYLMAAVADRILAAPFAIVGSIGVAAQIPNVHRLLKKHDVDVEVLTAGRYKRTLDVLGENTEQGRAKFREELEDIHVLFQEYVGRWRPKLDVDAVSTGEAWYGQRALDHALVDELVTSDEYLARACKDADVFEVAWVTPKPAIERLMGQVAAGVGKAGGRLLEGWLDKTTTGGIR